MKPRIYAQNHKTKKDSSEHYSFLAFFMLSSVIFSFPILSFFFLSFLFLSYSISIFILSFFLNNLIIYFLIFHFSLFLFVLRSFFFLYFSLSYLFNSLIHSFMVSFFPSFLSLSFDIYLYLHSFLSIIVFLPPQACLATLDWPSTLWQAAVSGLTPSSRRAAIQRLWQVQCNAIFSQATLVKKNRVPFLKYRRWLYISDFGCKPDVQQKSWYDRVRFQIDPSLDIAGLVPAPRGPWSIITVMKFRVWSLPPGDPGP